MIHWTVFIDQSETASVYDWALPVGARGWSSIRPHVPGLAPGNRAQRCGPRDRARGGRSIWARTEEEAGKESLLPGLMGP